MICFIQNFATDDATGDDARPMYRCKKADSGQNCGNMLIPDLALIYDFTIDDTTRFINCDPSGSALTCDKADTYDTVNTYSQVDFDILFPKKYPSIPNKVLFQGQ